jgi:hypothetical protein
MTELAAMAAQMHELFRAWVAAGFTEEQALRLLCASVAGNRGDA